MSVKQVFNFECDKCKEKLAHNMNRVPPGWRYLEWQEPLGAPNAGLHGKHVHLCPGCYEEFQKFLQGGFTGLMGSLPDDRLIYLRSDSTSFQVLRSFIAYCYDHPGMRFWQALKHWARAYQIMFVQPGNGAEEYVDTYYWKGQKG